MILALLDRALGALGVATVERCVSAERGPTPGAQIVACGLWTDKQLAAMSDEQLAEAYHQAYQVLHAQPVRAGAR